MGTNALFSWPAGVTLDNANNLFVADRTNNVVRKIDPAGTQSTFLGTSASFWWPKSIALDINGNMFVADAGNNLIRKISPSGVVSTLAGNGTAAFADGSGTSALFYYPSGLSLDGAGNVYVADSGNNLIRKISTSGVVSTFAGSGSAAFADGTGTSASFYFPSGLALDTSGNVYVADLFNKLVRKVTPNGTVSTFGPSFGGWEFAQPRGVAVDRAGNVYVADSGNNRIAMISPSGVVSTLAGNGTGGFADGAGTSATFYYPTGIALDGVGNIYVADRDNNCIRKMSTSLQPPLPPPRRWVPAM